MNRFVALFASALTLCGCVTQNAPQDGSRVLAQNVLSVCDVLARSQELVGRRVYVRGLYASDPHRRILADDNCSQGSIAVEISPTKRELELDKRMQDRLRRASRIGVPSIYVGVLKSQSIIYNCRRPECFVVTLSSARFVAGEDLAK